MLIGTILLCTEKILKLRGYLFGIYIIDFSLLIGRIQILNDQLSLFLELLALLHHIFFISIDYMRKLRFRFID